MLDLQSSWLSCLVATPAICSSMLASVRSWMKSWQRKGTMHAMHALQSLT